MATVENKITFRDAGVSATFEILPKSWGKVKRVTLSGPALLERVTIGRIDFDFKDGLNVYFQDGVNVGGELLDDPRYPDARSAGPDRLVRVLVTSTAAGEAAAHLEMETTD